MSILATLNLRYENSIVLHEVYSSPPCQIKPSLSPLHLIQAHPLHVGLSCGALSSFFWILFLQRDAGGLVTPAYLLGISDPPHGEEVHLWQCKCTAHGAAKAVDTAEMWRQSVHNRLRCAQPFGDPVPIRLSTVLFASCYFFGGPPGRFRPAAFTSRNMCREGAHMERGVTYGP